MGFARCILYSFPTILRFQYTEFTLNVNTDFQYVQVIPMSINIGEHRQCTILTKRMTKLVIDLFWCMDFTCTVCFTRELFSNQTSTIYQSKSLSFLFEAPFSYSSTFTVIIEANDIAFSVMFVYLLFFRQLSARKFSFIVTNFSSDFLCVWITIAIEGWSIESKRERARNSEKYSNFKRWLPCIHPYLHFVIQLDGFRKMLVFYSHRLFNIGW